MNHQISPDDQIRCRVSQGEPQRRGQRLCDPALVAWSNDQAGNGSRNWHFSTRKKESVLSFWGVTMTYVCIYIYLNHRLYIIILYLYIYVIHPKGAKKCEFPRDANWTNSNCDLKRIGWRIRNPSVSFFWEVYWEYTCSMLAAKNAGNSPTPSCRYRHVCKVLISCLCMFKYFY